MCELWKTLFGMINFKISPSTAYRSQIGGKKEAAILQLEEMSFSFSNYDKEKWDKCLTVFKD